MGRTARPLRRMMVAGLLGCLAVPLGTPASAPARASGASMGFYLSAPFVQTPVCAATIEDFNDTDLANPAPTPTTWSGISEDGGVVGVWQVAAGDQYGGATTTAPTAQGDPQQVTDETTRSRYARVRDGESLTISLSEPADYLGFWWSAGDDGNRVELYTDGGTRLVASLTTATVVEILNDGVGNVTSRDGTEYPSANYYGHPVSANQRSRATPAEPFAFVHAIADGGVAFDTVVLSQEDGGNFELDNFSVASGCDIEDGFITIEDDVLDPTYAASLAGPAYISRLAMACAPNPVVAGGTVSCEVTGGDPSIDILWEADLGGVFATAGVTLDELGNGRFSFTAPAGSTGRSIAVRLVDWNVADAVAVSGESVPTRLPAGGGPSGPAPALLVGGLMLLAGSGLTRLRSAPSRT